MTTVAIVSDTHGLLRPELVEALEGVERIIHAGDIGSSAVLEGLEQIAPVTAVRGNVDTGTWTKRLPRSAVVQLSGGLDLYVLHILEELDIVPHEAGIDAVVTGHTHRPSISRTENVWFLNPGSAGPRRFHLPVSFIRLSASEGSLDPQLVKLVDGPGSGSKPPP